MSRMLRLSTGQREAPARPFIRSRAMPAADVAGRMSLGNMYDTRAQVSTKKTAPPPMIGWDRSCTRFEFYFKHQVREEPKKPSSRGFR